MLRNPNGLSHAVVALLAGNIAFDVLFAVIELRFLLTDVAADSFDPAVFGTLDLNVAYSMAFTLYVATGIVFVVWFHRLRKNAEVWAGDLQGRKPGWAIGGWFVPIANLWIPRGIAADIWRASRWQPYAADAARELALLNAWWTFWVADVVVDRIATQLYKGAETAGAYTTAASWSLAGYLLDIAAAVLAILFVRRLTSMQHAKANGMIPATQ
ncbi:MULTISPECIES: DUF4328 domain-containing protein [unclassified Streptomyces]|uniref:DUF4328 domain-containing protein n=1 Tax=unclassified Streptomyces TaxID=2593676 RepID=UPI0006AF9FC2|nr:MULTISPECIES: DUF4328 domain-containing protein [unclassified Streptomyces]KOX26580.1 hypothetical protein ADL06_15315 [Streptomyces sp. NRRL F-6491]KOX49998.1 hypothetical protein ADL08_07340 [Streptomyces sp. NRRL F-6492]